METLEVQNSDIQTMSNNPALGNIPHPETRSNVATVSADKGEPVYSNKQGGSKGVEHKDRKENPVAPPPPYRCQTDISLIKEKLTSDAVTTPGGSQLLQKMDKLDLPGPRRTSNSINGERMRSTSMHNFRLILNQLLQAKRKSAEFNDRVPKPKGPRPPPAAWGKPAN